jgi:hypothetical protein
MSSRDPETITETAADRIANQGFESFLRNTVIGGIILAVAYGAIDLVQGLFGMLMRPLESVGFGISRFLDATFGRSVDIIEIGGRVAELSFIEGTARFLGPLAFPAAVLITMLTLWLFAEGWERVGFSPLDFVRRMRGR